MMGKEIDPSDIGKHPKVIRIAQNDMTLTDVLVCGTCHSVFHFIELFQEHKDMGCDKDSNLTDCRETKAKVWAFLLWKASQLSSNENSGTINSWKLYQTWVKMDESIRETWVVAGKTIQSFARMGQGNLQEMPVKITKTVVDNIPKAVSTPKMTQKTVDNKQIFKKEVHTDNEEEFSPTRPESNRIGRKPVGQFSQIKTPPNNVLPIKSINRRANRTTPNTNGQEFEEETVEKIIAKRFNPRRKMHEYLVKWEGFQHDQNTWEPHTHLESCPQLLDTFEKQLARQKEQRAAQALKQAAAASQQPNPTQIVTKSASPISPSITRPARNSKAKAMDQVKQWCADEDSNSVNASKRKHDDSDFDESGAGAEDDDDNFDDDEVHSPSIKKLKNGNSVAVRMDSKMDMRISQVPTTTTIKAVNGNVKSTTNEPSAEVIITKDTQSSGIVKKAGVVSTSSHKTEAQIRVLSKGENTASGIVRITATNKVPLSGITAGQTRITHITQKKDTVPPVKSVTQHYRTLSNTSTPSPRPVASHSRLVQRTTVSANTHQQTNKAVMNRTAKAQQSQQQQVSKAVTPEQKIIQLSKSGDLKVTRKVIHSTPPQATQHQAVANKIVVSNDLPEDPFPEPQSPPRPLTLCPITGKVLGQAEGEPSPVASPEAPKKEELNNHQQNLTLGVLHTNEVHDSQSNETGEELSHGITITSGEDGQTQQVLANEDGTPLLVTGDDGTIYQVAGKNAEGQTILIAQGADGEQQYAYVAAEDGEEGGMLTLDNAVAEAVAQMLPEQQAEALAAAAAAAGAGETQYILKQDDGTTDGTTDASQALSIQTGDAGDSQDGNIPAEVVQADLPSPGGTRRVVLLLQDGTFMMTEMHDDEYQALNIVT